MVVSNAIHDLRLSLNHPQNSADGLYIVILKNITKSYEYVNVSLLQLFLVVPVTQLDAGSENDTIFITQFSKPNKLYIASGSAPNSHPTLHPPPPPERKILGTPDKFCRNHTTSFMHYLVEYKQHGNRAKFLSLRLKGEVNYSLEWGAWNMILWQITNTGEGSLSNVVSKLTTNTAGGLYVV